jgi:hypothetical protein
MGVDGVHAHLAAVWTAGEIGTQVGRSGRLRPAEEKTFEGVQVGQEAAEDVVLDQMQEMVRG